MLNRSAKILIIDDDVELVTLLVDYFNLEGFVTTPAHTAEEGLKLLAQQSFDIVVLDVMLPGMSGTEALARIRENWHLPVLMLTARGDPVDRIVGLELGADDYVPKPCPPRELVARIRAILRRSSEANPVQSRITSGPIVIDTAQRTVTLNGKPLSLNGTEFTLLEVLARNIGHPVAKPELYPQVLSRPMGRYDRAIDVHVSAIRSKLAQLDPSAAGIESIRGVGYQLIYPAKQTS